jgi:hypothetical protein
LEQAHVSIISRQIQPRRDGDTEKGNQFGHFYC